MKEIKVVVREEMFKKNNVAVGQITASLNDELDLNMHGSLSVIEGTSPKDDCFNLKAAACNENGGILYVHNEYNISLVWGYNTFSFYCADVSRFYQVKELAYIELFPCPGGDCV